jgi:hypothetical protein
LPLARTNKVLRNRRKASLEPQLLDVLEIAKFGLISE